MPEEMDLQHVFIALVGLGFATVGPIQFAGIRRGWRRRTSRVMGTVIGHETRTVEGADLGRMPIEHAAVRYKLDGGSYVAVSRYGATWLKVRPGERRVVVYDPRDPSDGEVLSETGRQIETLLHIAVPLIGVALMAAPWMRWLD